MVNSLTLKRAVPALIAFVLALIGLVAWHIIATSHESNQPSTTRSPVMKRAEPKAATKKIVPTICMIHNKEMKEDNVPVWHGMPAVSKKYESAKAALFPNANTEVWGGCVVTLDSQGKEIQEYRIIDYCQACRDRQRKWLKEHEHK